MEIFYFQPKSTENDWREKEVDKHIILEVRKSLLGPLRGAFNWKSLASIVYGNESFCSLLYF